MKRQLKRFGSPFIAFICTIVVSTMLHKLLFGNHPTIQIDQPPPPQIAAVTQPTTQVDKPLKPHVVSLSPYEIKGLIDENNRAARRGQGYELDLEPIWKKLGTKPGDEIPCNGNCKATILKLELDGKPGTETVLRVEFDPIFICRYFVFKGVGRHSGKAAEWHLLGDVSSMGWWSDPEDRVETLGARRWLVIRSVTGHGSGFDSWADDWYELSQRGLVRVLSYQTDLFAGTWEIEPAIERKTQLLKSEVQNGIVALTLESSTSYKGYRPPNEYFPLWTTRRQSTFIRVPETERFIPDRLHSEMAEGELDPRFGDAVQITAGELLKYNYRELAKLAFNGSGKQKEWLRNYLKICDDTAEKQSLQKTLEGTRP